MGDARRLFDLLRRNPVNVSFARLVRLAEVTGFEEVRVRGSHHIFRHRMQPSAVLNLQEVGGQAKPYQVRQLVALIAEYGLLGEE